MLPMMDRFLIPTFSTRLHQLILNAIKYIRINNLSPLFKGNGVVDANVFRVRKSRQGSER
jgi:hypothetical protein